MLVANLFHLFSFFLLLSSIMVIVSTHPVFSLLFLASSFIFAAFLLFLLECEFLALIFIIIYVGAIAVLFLFAVMMLESKLSDIKKNVLLYLPVSVIIGTVTFFLFKSVFNEDLKGIDSYGFYANLHTNWYDLIDSTNDVEVYGQVLYSFFVLQFLVAGLILLVVLIGVVYLTNTYRLNEKTRDQVVFKQLARESKLKKNL